MEIQIFQVDAFADEVFKGNPAAVCPLDYWLDDVTLQSIASENNLSETAFFVKTTGGYHLRWFTPENEIDLCGHATLASAHVLKKHMDFQGDSVNFNSMSGILTVSYVSELYTLDFPARAGKLFEAPAEIIDGLGAEPEYVYKSRDYMAVFHDEETVRGIKPDFEKLKKLDATGIIITAPAKRYDFVSRFFAPAAGINEDPVTGSAHCTLIPYWSERLGKKQMVANQVSARGGVLYCEDKGNRVNISGRAVTYMKGTINI